MKTKTIMQLDTNELVHASALHEMGIPRAASRMIVYLIVSGPKRHADIEHGTGLYYPVITYAAKYLANRGWLKIEKMPNSRPGKRINIYSATVGLSDIVAELKREMDEKMEKLDKLVI